VPEIVEPQAAVSFEGNVFHGFPFSRELR
jgi:hypothetical protein